MPPQSISFVFTGLTKLTLTLPLYWQDVVHRLKESEVE
jgi:hypothetical protein